MPLAKLRLYQATQESRFKKLEEEVDVRGGGSMSNGETPWEFCHYIWQGKITEFLDNRNAVNLISLELSRAFNTVPHEKLLVKLKKMNISIIIEL